MRAGARTLGVVLGACLVASGSVAAADSPSPVIVRQTPAGLAQSVDAPRRVTVMTPTPQTTDETYVLFPEPVRTATATATATASLRKIKIKPIRVGTGGRGLAYIVKF